MELKIKFKLFDRLLSTNVEGDSVEDVMRNFHYFVMKNVKIDDIEIASKTSYQEIIDVLTKNTSASVVTHELDLSKPETVEKFLFILLIQELEKIKDKCVKTQNFKTAAVIQAEIAKRFDVSL